MYTDNGGDFSNLVNENTGTIFSQKRIIKINKLINQYILPLLFP